MYTKISNKILPKTLHPIDTKPTIREDSGHPQIVAHCVASIARIKQNNFHERKIRPYLNFELLWQQCRPKYPTHYIILEKTIKRCELRTKFSYHS